MVQMNSGEQRLCDDHEINGLIGSISPRKLAESRRLSLRPLCLVGGPLARRPLAQRLAQELQRLLGQDVDVGRGRHHALPRRSRKRRKRWPVLRRLSEIPFDVDGAEVVLVDDVFVPGPDRPRALALNAICDLWTSGVHPHGGPRRSGTPRDPRPARRRGPTRSNRSRGPARSRAASSRRSVEEVVKIAAGRRGTTPRRSTDSA